MAIDYIDTHLYKEPDREEMTNKIMLERNDLYIRALFRMILVLFFIL